MARPDIDALLIAQLLLLGCIAGFLAGLLGIGGGMLMVPFMTLLLGSSGFPAQHVVKMAIATSLATICFTSLASLRAHHRHGAVRWNIVGLLAPGMVIGSYLGAWFATLVDARVLSVLFALSVAYSATQMVFGRKPAATLELPDRTGMLAAGGTIGALSGMVGAGGAFISVPFMTARNVAIHNAVATSAALGFPIAIAGTISYIVNGLRLENMPPGTVGYLYLPALFVIVIASVLLAPLGARTAHRLDVEQLKRAFAVLLYGLAGYMLYGAAR